MEKRGITGTWIWIIIIIILILVFIWLYFLVFGPNGVGYISEESIINPPNFSR